MKGDYRPHTKKSYKEYRDETETHAHKTYAHLEFIFLSFKFQV